MRRGRRGGSVARSLFSGLRNGDQAACLAGLGHHGEKFAAGILRYRDGRDLFRSLGVALVVLDVEGELIVTGGERLVENGGEIA